MSADRIKTLAAVTDSPHWPDFVQIKDDDGDTVEIADYDIPELIERLQERLRNKPAPIEPKKVSGRTVVGAFWSLPSSVRREISMDMGLITQDELRLHEEKRVRLTFERARERDLVEEFSKRVMEAAGK